LWEPKLLVLKFLISLKIRFFVFRKWREKASLFTTPNSHDKNKYSEKSSLLVTLLKKI
jgi:hypothetical protein